jgi:FkbM family methyltransferase
MDRLTQHVFRLTLRAAPGASAGSTLDGILLGASKAYSRARHDPDVRYEWRGVALTLPFSHQLPAICSVHDDYSQNLGRVAAACARRYGDATMIDLGANIGDSLVVTRMHSDMPMLCVEGDSRYLPYLWLNSAQFKNVEIAPCYVGSSDGERRASVVASGGTAHLEFAPEGATRVTLCTLMTLTQQHPRFAGAGLLKLDTDGLDVAIIMSSAEFLRRSLPVVFFEYDPRLMAPQDAGPSVFSFLENLGYEGVVVWDNVGGYLLSATTSNVRLWADLHEYFLASRAHRYMDIAVFAASQRDLFEDVVGVETIHRRSRLRNARAAV